MSRYCRIHLNLTDGPLSSGDDSGGAGLPSASTHGLSHGAASADVGVLDEGKEPETQVYSHRQHVGQTAPQRRQPKGGDQQHVRVSRPVIECGFSSAGVAVGEFRRMMLIDANLFFPLPILETAWVEVESYSTD